MACYNSNENCSCNDKCCCNEKCGSNMNFVIILVLYILLAIILGTTICY